jgi:AbrB family looped-hinge helix DNA binding protein
LAYNSYRDGNTKIFKEQTMRLTSKGQVTIPQGIRELAGLGPGSEVEFQFIDGRVWLEKVEPNIAHRRQRIVATISEAVGTATANRALRTDDILHMTRGED